MSTHLHPDLRYVLGLSAEERIAFMDQPRWIGYPLANRIIEAMRGLMEKPSRPRMPNLLIVGESNNGKTTIVQRLSKLHGQGYVNEDADPVKPVIVTQSPPSADEKGLYIAILESFWAPYRPTDPVSKLRYQVIHQLRACHTRLLIIDEFHSLLTGGAVKQRETMNAIKLLCNELMLPIVGVGTRDAVRVLHSDPQHASRFDVVTLPAWTLTEDFQKLLAGFEKTLPLKQVSQLHKPELAFSLHAVSGGNLGDLHRLLIECANEAILSGKERIDGDIIQSKAWLRPTRGIREVTL
ncbi:TniB family NTP-binding protein [Halomonas glaciei]|jgi:hypothetical protein|uniref:TniB family NTP-binding protein n=1 Tax=Vreelandella glaciei TaxID=186761 RepID=A0A7Z0LQ81_9GAMM|nr:TniB family NTP-binding protein [Halomonas glaciei]NYS76585.1 TniB family NTP-binding protein [Halomonas glaciei]